MADLTDLQAAQTVKIAGADATGLETNPVKSSTNGDLGTSDVSNSGGVHGAITVGTSAVEAKVGANVLTSRKSLTVMNNSNVDWFWGYSSGVTTTTGTPIFKNQFISWSVGPSTSVFLIAGSAGHNGRVTENA